MKKSVFILFLFSVSLGFSQQVNKAPDDLAKQIAREYAQHDSFMKAYDSMNKMRDSISMSAEMERNTDNLVSFMRERDDKARKGMWTRIGLGIAMLIMLIIGLMRKRKKKM
ncbi:MAG: hypothetical protein ABIN74_12310 [Ferruginibacter sp.]